MDILVGLLFVVFGAALVFSGLRVFFAMLPLLGFIAGFGLGATLITAWLGDGFLSTVTGWIVGIILGLVFAAFSYLYWYVGALLSAGASGALLLSGLFSVFGVNSGWILTILAIVGAAIFIFAAMVLNLPVYVVLVNTAIVGAYSVIGGLMLIFGNVNRTEFDWGVARAAALDNWFWWIVLVALVTFGIVSQLSKIASITIPEERWVKAQVS